MLSSTNSGTSSSPAAVTSYAVLVTLLVTPRYPPEMNCLRHKYCVIRCTSTKQEPSQCLRLHRAYPGRVPPPTLNRL
eukprot:515812-Rhodomonas_salina.2